MAICRDVSLLPPIIYIFTSLKKTWEISFQTKLATYDPQSLKDALMSLWQNYMVDNNMTTATTTTTTIAAAAIVSAVSTPISTPSESIITNQQINSLALLNELITARASEHFLCALWCLVSLYLTYVILDSLMIRWIVKYSTVAAIMRMFSMSLVLITVELLLLTSLSPEHDYFLHTWILISCILTVAYIWQNYLTSDLKSFRETEDTTSVSSSSSSSDSDIDTIVRRRRVKKRKQSEEHRNKRMEKSFQFKSKRTIDLYNIIVFCVVPVGMASFITMGGLLRNLFIQRLDVEQLTRMLQETLRTSTTSASSI